jgi:quercetin dioxygenase-like cupin family protein
VLQTYERPYRPIELDGGLVTSFPLFSMVEQLRAEDVYERTGRDALTLIHGKSLTVVLTVARKGTSCDEHHVPHDALIIALDGWITIASPTRDEPLGLHPGSVAALAADVPQTITAQEDSAFLTVLSC